EQLTTLDVWDDKLIQLGAQIIDARQRLATDMTEPLARAYAAIAGEDHSPRIGWALSIGGSDPEDDPEAVEIGASGATSERFREALLTRRTQELDRGLTLVGPHRDDLVLHLRGLPVKGYASHGEGWS